MIGCDCFRRNGVMQSMGKERSEGHMILTIIILVLFHVGRKNASASFHGKKKKDPGGFHETYRKEEGLIVLRDLLFSQRISLEESVSKEHPAGEVDLPARQVGREGYHDNRWMNGLDVFFSLSQSFNCLLLHLAFCPSPLHRVSSERVLVDVCSVG